MSKDKKNLNIFSPQIEAILFIILQNFIRKARCVENWVIFKRQSTDIPPTVDRYSTDSQWLTYRPSVDRYIDRDIDRYAADISTDISADISTDISTDISRLICRSSVGRYVDGRSICRSSVGQFVDRHIGRVSVNMSTDTRPMYRPIHRWRGAQNTHDRVIK